MNKNKTEHVILVNEHDQEIGTEEKIIAHQKGLLHRAFSIFVFNEKHKLLLQKRAAHKYHTGNLWANTCCSHPRPGEKIEEAIHRRLQEEMGFDCPLTYAFSFVYKVRFEKDNLFEHEYDHVFVGHYDKNPTINKEEVSDYAWVPFDQVFRDVKKHPEKFAYWFKIILETKSDILATYSK